MSAYLSPIGNEQQNDANGSPLSGGLIYTYSAGTTTPIATYTGTDGLTPQANPIVLNSSGLPASPIWLPAGQAVKLVIQNSAAVVQRTVDNVVGINDPSSVAANEWTIFTGAPTFVSTTSFALGGDQTLLFQVLRRIKSANTGGTVYSTISAATYNAGTGLTTVTVVNSSGVLDSGISQVSYGLLSATNPSLPETSVGKSVRTLSAGSVIDRTYTEYVANADLATVIPYDNTIPQNTEGTQILTASITPKSATSRLRVRAQAFGSTASSGDAIILAAFQNSVASAIAASIGSASVGAGSGTSSVLEFEFVPGVTTVQTINIRCGGTVGTIRLNGTTSSRIFGGVARSTLIVEEIAV